MKNEALFAYKEVLNSNYNHGENFDTQGWWIQGDYYEISAEYNVVNMNNFWIYLFEHPIGYGTGVRTQEVTNITPGKYTFKFIANTGANRYSIRNLASPWTFTFDNFILKHLAKNKGVEEVAYHSTNTVGDKRYELANHLGNVLEVVSDRKLPISDLATVPKVVSYTADVMSYSDYYPFGQIMPNRHGADDAYRYGFNGQEKDNEISGNGNSNTAEFWQYDTRLGRRWNQDPKPNPSISNYACFANNPVWFSDHEGDTIRLAGTKIQKFLILRHMQKLTNDKLILNGDLVVIKNHGTQNKGKNLVSGSGLVKELIEENNTVTISIQPQPNEEQDLSGNGVRVGGKNAIGCDTEIHFNPILMPKILTKDSKTGRAIDKERPHEIGLGHEMIHAWRAMKGIAINYNIKKDFKYLDAQGKMATENKPLEELQTVGLAGNSKYSENKLRKEQGLEPRAAY